MNFVGTNYSYYLTPEKFETDSSFYHRGWIIAKMQPQTPEDFEEASTYAKLWWNWKNGCRYSAQTEQNINQWKEKYEIS